jgi:hypothetical protein
MTDAAHPNAAATTDAASELPFKPVTVMFCDALTQDVDEELCKPYHFTNLPDLAHAFGVVADRQLADDIARNADHRVVYACFDALRLDRHGEDALLFSHSSAALRYLDARCRDSVRRSKNRNR